MDETPIIDMLNLAQALAGEAASISLPALGQAKSVRKPDDSVVTETDYAIQERIAVAVAEAYPNHAVVGEETLDEARGRADPRTARYCWVIDPLDGSRNYAAGFPCFATSIAVLDQGRPVVAVVSEHNLGLLYAATLGGGATLGGEPIRVAEPAPGEDFLVGIPSSKDRFTVNVLQSWVATRGLICRNTGSTALHLAMVASGALSAAFAKRAKIWDVAAGALLVTETGGRFTDPTGGELLPFALDADADEDLPFVAGPPRLHRRLIESIQAAVRQQP